MKTFQRLILYVHIETDRTYVYWLLYLLQLLLAVFQERCHVIFMEFNNN